jgi:hypothetical protein
MTKATNITTYTNQSRIYEYVDKAEMNLEFEAVDLAYFAAIECCTRGWRLTSEMAG